MKVKELIKKLAELDWEKEMFIHFDWCYLHEDNTYFKETYCFSDFELNKWYFLKAEDKSLFVEELGNYGTRADIKDDIDIAKKYMKEEWYGDIIEEGECYYLD